MLRINRKTDYAVRVMLALARQAADERLSRKTIETEMLIPGAILGRIVAELAQAGLIDTFTGPNGGLLLARPAEAIKLLHIWEAIEGPPVISDCLISCDACDLAPACPVRRRWARLQGLIIRELEATSLAELAQEVILPGSYPVAIEQVSSVISSDG